MPIMSEFISKPRKRSSSLVHDLPMPTAEQERDAFSDINRNADWVDHKGAWLIHIVLIVLLRLLYNAVPGVSAELSWTLTNLTYMAGSYTMFHFVKGVPFDFNSGVCDQLTMWEQFDQGAQYTPAKKYLTAVPIVLFLLSTHYTHYDLWMFLMNLWALTMVLVPKLPQTHRKRVFGFTKFNLEDTDYD